MSGAQGKLEFEMNKFAILTNRKRALIALIHSVVFLGIAMHGFAAAKAGFLHGRLAPGDIILLVIYVIVASVLAWLASISSCMMERIYFILCMGSASFSLLRTVFGDSALPAAQYFRVLCLAAAVLLGTWILRSFPRLAAENVICDWRIANNMKNARESIPGGS
jgi:hypothetical protein